MPTTTTTSPTDLARRARRPRDRAGGARRRLDGRPHRACGFALDHPERVAGLVHRHPGVRPRGRTATAGSTRWDALGRGPAHRRRRRLRRGLRRPAGARAVEGDDRHGPAPAAGRPRAPRRASPTRCSAVPRSRPFESWDELGRDRRARPWSWPAATRPTPSTRTRSASATPRRSPARSCAREEPGSSPLAWQGGQLSKVISELAERAGACRAMISSAALHDQVAVVGGGELGASRPRDSRATKQAARPGPSAVTVQVPRSGSSGASGPVRTPAPRELGRRAQGADERRASSASSRSSAACVGRAWSSSGNAASTTAVSPSASAWRMISRAVALGQLARADRRALPVRDAAERRLARQVAAGVGQPQLAPGLGQLARQRRRLAEQVALAERGAERARGGELLLGVDALGQHQRLAALALRADRADDPRDVRGLALAADGAGRA